MKKLKDKLTKIEKEVAALETENAELKEKDICCANSVDEMIARCEKCGLNECCGCEHDYTAVQEVKALKAENNALRARLKKVAIFALDLCEEAADCAGDMSVGLYPCPMWQEADLDANGKMTEAGCLLEKYIKDLAEAGKDER